jgi:DNA helicase-2/ATP-dependent DNA helicase PcrA
MMADGEIAADLGSRFDHIFVDEYQDTNHLQAAILLGLKPDGRGVTVVGDDAQAIYSFRSATVRNIIDFPAKFSPPATVLTLERNYRSTQPILAAANAVIGLAAERFTKNLWSERVSSALPVALTVRDESDQATCVADQVLENRERGIPLKSQAVLFRTSHHSGPLEVELVRRNIPFVKFGGLKFLDIAHIKDLLALLRWVENPRDRVSGFRLLQVIPGIGPTSAGNILDYVAQTPDALASLQTIPFPPRAGEEWIEFVEVIGRLRKETGWPAELEIARLWYEPHLERIHEDAEVRKLDLMQLQQSRQGIRPADAS